MPSKSKSQARMMAAVAHSPEFAAKVGISQKVGKEFNKADVKKGLLKTTTKAGKKLPERVHEARESKRVEKREMSRKGKS